MNAFYSILTFHFKHHILYKYKLAILIWWKSTQLRKDAFSLGNEWNELNMSHFQSLRVNISSECTLGVIDVSLRVINKKVRRPPIIIQIIQGKPDEICIKWNAWWRRRLMKISHRNAEAPSSQTPMDAMPISIFFRWSNGNQNVSLLHYRNAKKKFINEAYWEGDF